MRQVTKMISGSLLTTTLVCVGVGYYSSYKRWLAKLLGKQSISNIYCLVFTLLIALFAVLIIVLIALLLGLALAEPCYCMDTLAEARFQLLDKITSVQGKIEYFTGQAKETDFLYKQSLSHNLPYDIQQERLTAKRESETNLNMERKVLRVLKQRLDSGDFNTSFSTSSSLGKRNFEE